MWRLLGRGEKSITVRISEKESERTNVRGRVIILFTSYGARAVIVLMMVVVVGIVVAVIVARIIVGGPVT